MAAVTRNSHTARDSVARAPGAQWRPSNSPTGSSGGAGAHTQVRGPGDPGSAGLAPAGLQGLPDAAPPPLQRPCAAPAQTRTSPGEELPRSRPCAWPAELCVATITCGRRAFSVGVLCQETREMGSAHRVSRGHVVGAGQAPCWASRRASCEHRSGRLLSSPQQHAHRPGPPVGWALLPFERPTGNRPFLNWPEHMRVRTSLCPRATPQHRRRAASSGLGSAASVLPPGWAPPAPNSRAHRSAQV